jgi:prophage regulatory protein
MISDRSVGWPTYEVEAINAARIAGMTQDEIRKLVADLEAQRKTRLDALRGEHQDRQSISEEEAASDD